MKTIAIVTDSWHPEMNGVIVTIESVKKEIEKLGYEVKIISPNDFINIPCPTYKEIRLSLFPRGKMKKLLKKADAIHLATEGPLGFSAREICLKKGWCFSSAFHTKLPEYVNEVIPIVSVNWLYKLVVQFHEKSSGVLVPVNSVKHTLEEYGLKNVKTWSRGVNVDLFRPQNIDLGFAKPVHLYVGRIAVHKNLHAFLDLDLPGSKVLVGYGPELEYFKHKYPDAHFVGRHEGENLARYYASADVFVFPSLTDTYGIVQLEAMACGLPVAAFPVSGPKDIIENGVNGWLDENLGIAIQKALEVSRETCHQFALRHTWTDCAREFLNNVVLKNGKNIRR